MGIVAGGIGIYLATRRKKEEGGPVYDSAGDELNVGLTYTRPAGNEYTLGWRLNNPFNIRWFAGNNWLGQTGKDSGFAVFSHKDYGVRAAIIDVSGDIVNDGIKTIRGIIAQFAPEADGNNVEGYVDYVAGKMGVSGNHVIESKEDLAKLLVNMAYVESRTIIPYEGMLSAVVRWAVVGFH